MTKGRTHETAPLTTLELKSALLLYCKQFWSSVFQVVTRFVDLKKLLPLESDCRRESESESESESDARKRKEAFLFSLVESDGRDGRSYGYDGTIEVLRAEEFSRLDRVVYLDHAGATLYSEMQIKKYLEKLESNVFGNPHSQLSAAGAGEASKSFKAARQAVLSIFNTCAEDYLCIFTSGATAGLKLVGETFPWTTQSSFVYTVDNHNSVLGIRNYALDGGSAAAAARVCTDDDGCFDIRTLAEQSREGEGDGSEAEASTSCSLFAFPAESNFSGVRYNLELLKQLKSKKCKVNGKSSSQEWFVLLDSAKACSTKPPDLSKYPADFVAISFYKIFGYPSGLGALLVRKDSAEILNRRYFGGGTVQVSVAEENFFRRRPDEDGWEDGTLPFLSIQALQSGFEQINKLSFPKIESHTKTLTTYTANKMREMKHSNGRSVCELYGRHCEVSLQEEEKFQFETGQGPVIAFNVLRSDSSYVGYREVETLGEACEIVLRTGCHCNPGACSTYLKLKPEETKANFENGHVCWDDKDVMNGKPTGSVRISFGYMSTFEDADSFLQFIERTFAEAAPKRSLEPCASPSGPVLKGIFVYPIKSCQGFKVNSWPILESGLLFDRKWAIADENGFMISQKNDPKLAQIETLIDMNSRALHLRATGMASLCSSIDEKSALKSGVESWLCEFTGKKYQLLENQSTDKNFSNRGGCLLVSTESVREILGETGHSLKPLDSACMQFRPNLLVEGGLPFQEESWKRFSVGGNDFEKTLECSRCGMVSIDQKDGKKKYKSLLLALSKKKSGLKFGIICAFRSKKGSILTDASPVTIQL